jgi:hypothetical protein
MALLTNFTAAISFADVVNNGGGSYNSTLNFRVDQLSEGYDPNDVQVGDRIVTSDKLHFEVTAINSTNFSNASVVLQGLGTTNAPSGAGMIYHYDGVIDLVSLPPLNSSGISSAVQANILIHNFELLKDIEPGNPVTAFSVNSSSVPGGRTVSHEFTITLLGGETFQQTIEVNRDIDFYLNSLVDTVTDPTISLLTNFSTIDSNGISSGDDKLKFEGAGGITITGKQLNTEDDITLIIDGSGISTGDNTVVTAGDITGDGSAGNPVTYVRPAPSWNELTDIPPGFADNIDDEGAFTDDQNLSLSDGTGGSINIDIEDGTSVTFTPGTDIGFTRIGNAVTIDSTATPASGGAVFTDIQTHDSVEYRSVFIQQSNVTQETPTFTGTFPTNQHTLDAKTHTLLKTEITGDSNTTNSLGEYKLTIDNLDAENMFFNYQIIDKTSNQKIDEHARGNILTQQRIGSDQILITIPNIGGNYPNGFILILS